MKRAARFLLTATLALGFSANAWAQSAADVPVSDGFPLPPTVPAGIPRQALIYRRQIIRETHYYWGLNQTSAPFFAQIHRESTFNGTAKSAYAVGLAQFTVPTASDAQRLFAADLRDQCDKQGGCPGDPQWAIRALVLWDRRLYVNRNFAAGDERWAFVLADYNGGAGWINRERTYCLLTRMCDQVVYFSSVETACGKSTPARNAKACSENGSYSHTILQTLRPLYEAWVGSE